MFRLFFNRKPIMVHLLHIGKTGGTSLTKMLQGICSKKYTIKIHPHEFSLQDIRKEDLAIFFLRNPIDRYVSGFYSRKRKGQPTYNVPWNESEENAFGMFETPNNLAEALSSDNKMLQASAIKAMQGIRHVNTHFKDWLVDISYLENHQNQLFFIGFQESFSADVKTLYQKLTGKTWAQEVVKSHQTSVTEDKTLSEIAIINLTRWYQEDINLYQYCKTLSQRVN